MAACWSSLMTLGENGYMRIAKGVMETTLKLKEGIKGADQLPPSFPLSFSSSPLPFPVPTIMLSEFVLFGS